MPSTALQQLLSSPGLILPLPPFQPLLQSAACFINHYQPCDNLHPSTHLPTLLEPVLNGTFALPFSFYSDPLLCMVLVSNKIGTKFTVFV